MKILSTKTFEVQLKDLLKEYINIDFSATKNYKLYLDTVILNMPTKFHKLQKSIYFDDEDIKDIDHQGHLIPVFFDKKNNSYIILGIVKK
jgi:hypothetical protein